MVTLGVQYQPFFFLKYTRLVYASFPSSYKELSDKQLIAVSRLMHSEITENVFLRTMTGFKKSIIRKLDAYHRYKLMELFSPFSTISPCPDFFIKSLRCNSVTLYPPKAKLHGVTFSQFIFAESFFTTYQASNKKEDLCKFVASLYLPKNVAFSESLIQQNCSALQKTDIATLEAISMNYVLIHEWLSLAFPLVFVKEEDLNTSENTPQKQNDQNGWLKIFESIVGDDLVNYDRYALLPVHTVFRWMTSKIKENMKRK